MSGITCPKCGHPVHDIFSGDRIRRWRCMACERIFSELEYQFMDGELVRRCRHAEIPLRKSQSERTRKRSVD